MSQRHLEIQSLRLKRPTNRFLRFHFLGILILLVTAWIYLDIPWSEIFSSRRIDNLQRYTLGSCRCARIRSPSLLWYCAPFRDVNPRLATCALH